MGKVFPKLPTSSSTKQQQLALDGHWELGGTKVGTKVRDGVGLNPARGPVGKKELAWLAIGLISGPNQVSLQMRIYYTFVSHHHRREKRESSRESKGRVAAKKRCRRGPKSGVPTTH